MTSLLRQIEKILSVMKYTEDQKISFTSFMFQGEAEYWWEVVRNGAKYSKEEITWDFLVKKFNENYSPGVMKDKLVMEFHGPKQEQMTLS